MEVARNLLQMRRHVQGQHRQAYIPPALHQVSVTRLIPPHDPHKPQHFPENVPHTLGAVPPGKAFHGRSL